MKIEADFISSLTNILTGSASDDDKEKFCETYIYPETAELFPYIKDAADKGFIEAYDSLGNCYAKGIGCPVDWEKAFYYWNLSVQHGGYGYGELGNCYRLGLGTEKNYDKAWEMYTTALKQHDNILENPSIEELLLISERYPSIEHKLIEISWLEYAVKKQTETIPVWLYREIAFQYFQEDSEGYLHWTNMAAQAGDIEAKCTMYYKIQDPVIQQKLIQEIFCAERYGDVLDSVSELAKEIIDNKTYEELAARFLDKVGEFDWLADHYQKQNRVDELEYILENADDNRSEDEIPEGYFRCSCCGNIVSIDDQENPDAPGTICNDCYFSGDCLHKKKF